MSSLTFSWFTSTIWSGYRRPLRREDVPKLNAYDRSAAVQYMWTEQWRPRPAATKGKLRDANDSYRQAVHYKPQVKGEGEVLIKEPATLVAKGGSNVLWSVLKMHKWTYITAAFLKVIFVALQLVSPLILKFVINLLSTTQHSAIHTERSSSLCRTRLHPDGTATCTLRRCSSSSNYRRSSRRNDCSWCSVRAWLARLCLQRQSSPRYVVSDSQSMLQTLLLSHQARSEKNVGEIVNLMSIDAAKFEDISWFLMVFWSSPLQVNICYNNMPFSRLPS